MRNYRIIKITYRNDEVCYKIQRECKYLRKYVLCGPKVWKTYEEIYEGNWCSHTGWCFNVRYGDVFPDENQAREKLEELIHNANYIVDKIEVL